MNVSAKYGKPAFLLAATAVAAAGAVTLFTGDAHARPGPLCGPTIAWICTFPDGHSQFFGGTVCQMAAFEHQTGATCIPSDL